MYIYVNIYIHAIAAGNCIWFWVSNKLAGTNTAVPQFVRVYPKKYQTIMQQTSVFGATNGSNSIRQTNQLYRTLYTIEQFIRLGDLIES